MDLYALPFIRSSHTVTRSGQDPAVLPERREAKGSARLVGAQTNSQAPWSVGVCVRRETVPSKAKFTNRPKNGIDILPKPSQLKTRMTKSSTRRRKLDTPMILEHLSQLKRKQKGHHSNKTVDESGQSIEYSHPHIAEEPCKQDPQTVPRSPVLRQGGRYPADEWIPTSGSKPFPARQKEYNKQVELENEEFWHLLESQSVYMCEGNNGALGSHAVSLFPPGTILGRQPFLDSALIGDEHPLQESHQPVRCASSQPEGDPAPNHSGGRFTTIQPVFSAPEDLDNHWNGLYQTGPALDQTNPPIVQEVPQSHSTVVSQNLGIAQRFATIAQQPANNVQGHLIVERDASSDRREGAGQFELARQESGGSCSNSDTHLIPWEE